MYNLRHIDADRPSAWLERFAGLIACGGEALDLACGHGRHSRYLADRGHIVEAVDRDAECLAALSGLNRVSTRLADLEGGPWPYAGRRFAGIVVTNYLHRPLYPRLTEALADGGVLICETFMLGNERFGRPSNPDFLLRPNELIEAFGKALHIVAFEQGEVAQPKPAVVQRLCAVKGAGPFRLP